MPKNKEKVPFDIHRKIRKYLSERNITVASLARDIQVRPITLHQQLHRKTIQVNRLWSICRALKWNLFQEIANNLEQELHKEQAKQKRIEISDIHNEVNQLKRKIELLENENKTLKDVISLLKP